MKKEYFVSKETCNPFFKNNSFCSINKDQDKCECVYQKDSILYQFDSQANCCKQNCSELPLDKCTREIDNDFGVEKMPYYCNIGGNCIEYQGTIANSHISANNCGIDPLNNQLLLPYASLEECKRSIDICDKYNDPTSSVSRNKDRCLQNPNCGYCTNDTGEGKCISGTSTGPNDLLRYYYCNSNTKTDVNKYTHY